MDTLSLQNNMEFSQHFKNGIHIFVINFLVETVFISCKVIKYNMLNFK